MDFRILLQNTLEIHSEQFHEQNLCTNSKQKTFIEVFHILHKAIENISGKIQQQRVMDGTNGYCQQF